MDKVLVTGGAGFIGSHLAEALVRAGFDVTVVDDLSSGVRAYVPRAARFRKLDVRAPQLTKLIQDVGPAYVCHLAAQISATRSKADAAADASVNIVGSLNLLESLKGLRLKKFLFVSTAALYGDAREIPTTELAELKPLSPYALSKLTVERYLEYYEAAYGIPYVVVRPSNVYGPRQETKGEGGVVAMFCRALMQSKSIMIEGRGEQTRDFLFVADAAAGMLAALLTGRGTFNLSTGHELTIRELAVKSGEVAGVVPQVRYAPPREQEISRSALSALKASRELDWHAQVPLPEGLRQTLKWFKQTV